MQWEYSMKLRQIWTRLTFTFVIRKIPEFVKQWIDKLLFPPHSQYLPQQQTHVRRCLVCLKNRSGWRHRSCCRWRTMINRSDAPLIAHRAGHPPSTSTHRLNTTDRRNQRHHHEHHLSPLEGTFIELIKGHMVNLATTHSTLLYSNANPKQPQQSQAEWEPSNG